MSGIQPYLGNALFDHIFRGNAFAMPSDLFIALFVGAVEVTGGSYARVSCHGAGAWTSPVNGAGSNVGAIIFPTATAPWGLIDHYGIFDAITAGNMYVYDQMAVAHMVNSGDTASFLAAAFQEAFQ